MSEQVRGRYWGRQMGDLMSEMARQATICKVRLLDPGVIDAVIRNDESVCGTSNPLSFKKLRDAMLMGFVVKGKSVDALGPAETEGLVTAIRERIKSHMGDQLGGLTSSPRLLRIEGDRSIMNVRTHSKTRPAARNAAPPESSPTSSRRPFRPSVR